MGARISSAIRSAVSIIVIPTLALQRAVQGEKPVLPYGEAICYSSYSYDIIFTLCVLF